MRYAHSTHTAAAALASSKLDSIIDLGHNQHRCSSSDGTLIAALAVDHTENLSLPQAVRNDTTQTKRS